MCAIKSLRLALLASALALAPAAANAAAGGNSAAEQIARINESIAILTAQKAELELRAQIAQRQAEIDKVTGSHPGGPGGAAAAAGNALGLPVVRSIEGMDGRLRAVLAFNGGMLQTVRQGEKIAGDWTVSDISTGSITLTRGREIVRLGPTL
ncbi:MAG: type pilus biosis protein PilP [Paucimonas sp.]|nr:type pilus biosis protein PilP [Paucimonas sp.]